VARYGQLDDEEKEETIIARMSLELVSDSRLMDVSNLKFGIE
jgi:hypothetical protein